MGRHTGSIARVAAFFVLIYAPLRRCNLVRLLQDSLNRVRTNWDRSMSEQVQDNILVLKNYGGESLNDFKDNLVKYGAVKVRDEGGVEVLNIPRESSSGKVCIMV